MAEETYEVDEEIKRCVTDCFSASIKCRETLMYCIQMRDRHSEPDHLSLLMDCADISEATANMMLRESDFDDEMAELNAQICARCAESCESFGDDLMMSDCARLCRKSEASSRIIADRFATIEI